MADVKNLGALGANTPVFLRTPEKPKPVVPEKAPFRVANPALAAAQTSYRQPRQAPQLSGTGAGKVHRLSGAEIKGVHSEALVAMSRLAAALAPLVSNPSLSEKRQQFVMGAMNTLMQVATAAQRMGCMTPEISDELLAAIQRVEELVRQAME